MLQRLGFPDITGHRRFVAALGVDAVGGGIFMPLAVLYFLATSDLSLTEVGTAMSIAALVGVPLIPLVGHAVDRFGPKPMLLLGNAILAATYVAYLVATSYAVVQLVLVLAGLGQALFWGSFGPMVASITRPGEREHWFGFLQAMRNLGFAIGGLLSGVAVAIGTVAAYHAVVVVNASSFVLALGLVAGVRATRPDVSGAEAVRDEAARATPEGWGTVLRDRGYMLGVLNQLTFALNSMALNFVIPVYAVTLLGLPGWVTGALFTVNTVMVGIGQGLVVGALVGRIRWRVLVLANAFFVAGYALLAGAAPLPVVPAVALVLVGVAVYTLGELTGGPVLSAIGADAAPEHLRGRYMSVMQASWSVAGVIAPAGFAWLLARGTQPVWIALAAISALGVLLSRVVGRQLPTAGREVTPL